MTNQALNLTAWQAMAGTTTLIDLITWQARRRKADDDSVWSFLERSLNQRAASLGEERRVHRQMMVPTGASADHDAVALLLEETVLALQADGQFRTGFFDGPGRMIVGTQLEAVSAEAERHCDRATSGRALVQAAVERRLTLPGDSYLAMIRAADLAPAESQPS